MISRQISMFLSQKFGQTVARQGKSTKYFQNWGSEAFSTRKYRTLPYES